jgi:hypothetical protein
LALLSGVPGEALDDADKQVIDGNIDSVLEEIERIAVVADRDDIPNKFF